MCALAIERIEFEPVNLLGDGEIVGKYYRHNWIDLEYKGLHVRVGKPYSDNPLGGVPYGYIPSKPSISFTTKNKNITYSRVDLNYVSLAIDKAIKILNSENDGVYIDPLFKIAGGDCLRRAEVEKYKGKENKKHIKNIRVKRDVMYEDDRGHLWIYVGDCTVLCNGRVVNKEMHGNICRYCYIRCDNLVELGAKITKYGEIHINCEANIVETCAQKKRFIRQHKEIGMHIISVVCGSRTYTFLDCGSD